MLEKLSSLSKKLARLPEIVAIILYGSFARGEAGPKSDIDLLIILKKRSPKLEEKIEKTINSESIGKRVVQTISTADELTKTPYYLFDILRDGIILYKNPETVLKLPITLGKEAASIYCFDSSGLMQDKRAKLSRILYGGKFIKKLKNEKMKKYSYKGLTEKLKGKKLGTGVIMVPSALEKEFEQVFKNFKVKYEKIHIIFIESL